MCFDFLYTFIWSIYLPKKNWKKYRVIQKDGLNFVSLYFRIRTSDKYDVNYIWLYSQRSI